MSDQDNTGAVAGESETQEPADHSKDIEELRKQVESLTSEATKWKEQSRKQEQAKKDALNAADKGKAALTELEQVQAELKELRGNWQKAETEVLKTRVAKRQGKELPDKALGLLQGTTQEELEASADSILELLGSAKQAQAQLGYNGFQGQAAGKEDAKLDEFQQALKDAFDAANGR